MCNLEVKGCYSIPVQCFSQVVQSSNSSYAVVFISGNYKFVVILKTCERLKWIVAKWLKRIGPGKKVVSFFFVLSFIKNDKDIHHFT